MNAPQFGYYQSVKDQTPARLMNTVDLLELVKAPTQIGRDGHYPAIAQHDGQGKTKEQAQQARFAFVAIDHDHDNQSKEQIQAAYSALSVPYLAFTSMSHQQTINKNGKAITPTNKWKVVIPFSHAVDAETFAKLSAGITRYMCADVAQARIQQVLYTPNTLDRDARYDFIDALGDSSQWLDPFTGSDGFAEAAKQGLEQLQAEREETASTAALKPRPKVANQQGGIIELINSAYELSALLTAHGYKRIDRDYLAPNSSSGVAGVRILERDGKQVLYSHHGSASDPLSAENHSGHALDVADVLAELGYNGDFSAMLAKEADSLDPAGQKQRQRDHMAAQVKPVDFETIEAEAPPPETQKRNSGDYAEILASTKLGTYAAQVADYLQIPRDTVTLTALGVVSAPVSMLYRVGYEHSGYVPSSLYMATEQPASSGKSAALGKFVKPIQQAIAAMNYSTAKANAKTGDDEANGAFYKAFITDATPEALDNLLMYQRGHFCLASAEQGLVNVALGLSYGKERKSNNDLILKGFSGDWHSSGRVSRQGYEGDVVGAITVIAQRGTIDTILEQSNGTGIAERFIMLAEPTLLGYRQHTASKPIPCMNLATDYANAVESMVQKYEQLKDTPSAEYDNLTGLHLARACWGKIRQRQQELEPFMADGGRYSHEMLRGVVGKYDQRVMKLAAVLHVVEALMAGDTVDATIKHRFVDMALLIANLSIEQLYQAMMEKGLIGMSAEQEAIYNTLTKRGDNGMPWQELYNAVKGKQPFKSYPSKGLAAKIRQVCRTMVEAKLLDTATRPRGSKQAVFYYPL